MLASSSVCLANDLCTSGVWSNIFALCTRTTLPVCFYFFMRRSMTRCSCSLPPLGVFWTSFDDSSPLLESPLPRAGISGYMARKSSSKVVGTLDPEPGSWDPEPGTQSIFLGSFAGGRAAVFPALGHGSFRGTIPMEFDEYTKAFYPPRHQEELVGNPLLDLATDVFLVLSSLGEVFPAG
ncbi:hypothetical protein Bca101_050397 [Brassica carinata]